MDKIIHTIVTDIKFLYPCIAYGEESIQGKELLITAETYISRLYPIKKSVKGMDAVGEDFWGRLTFKDEEDLYYCEVDGELYFKGSDIEGEPQYPVKRAIDCVLPDIDKEISEINPCIEKVKEYIKEKTDFKLVEVKTSLQENAAQPSRSKVICYYRLGL